MSLRYVKDYYCRVMRRGWNDTISALDWRSYGVGLLLFILGCLFHYWLYGLTSVIEEMVSYSTFSLIAPLAGLFFLLLFKIAVAPAEMERDVLALVPNPEPTMIRLEDVAAELLARLRGKPAYEFLSYNTDGSSDMLRRAADYVTNYYGVYGRIPGTTVRQFIPPGTHFMRLNSGSMLVATSDTSKGVADFEDLAMPKEEVNDVLSDVSSRIIEIAKSHQ